MNFVLVRHGETDSNKNRIVQVPATPLNARGIAQAEAVAQRLARELSSRAGHTVRLMTSDLARAAMTAAPIAKALGVSAQELPLLQERNFGDLRGRAYAEIGTDIMAPGYAPPAGETWEMFNERVARAWDALREQFKPTETLIAVSHGLVCRSLAANHFETEGSEPPTHWGNTSVSIVDLEPPHRAHTLNCTEHLEGLTADSGQISGI